MVAKLPLLTLKETLFIVVYCFIVYLKAIQYLEKPSSVALPECSVLVPLYLCEVNLVRKI